MRGVGEVDESVTSLFLRDFSFYFQGDDDICGTTFER